MVSLEELDKLLPEKVTFEEVDDVISYDNLLMELKTTGDLEAVLDDSKKFISVLNGLIEFEGMGYDGIPALVLVGMLDVETADAIRLAFERIADKYEALASKHNAIYDAAEAGNYQLLEKSILEAKQLYEEFKTEYKEYEKVREKVSSALAKYE